ncbi:MAG: hypothetical protein ACLF0P_18000 [Thermoanaerobaculia bacterium]
MKTTLTFVLAVLCSTAAFAADVDLNATLCNNTTKPVEFHLFNHNDLAQGLAALATKAVAPCSCVAMRTHTDFWHNMPIARINQLVFRDVESVSGGSIKVCVDANGEFEGYIDAKVQTCAEAKKETKYLPAPELTHAQGDLPVLQSHLYADSSECKNSDSAGACSRYEAAYNYTDGAACWGN